MSQLVVTKPEAGLTFAQPDSPKDDDEFLITWTTPDAIASRPVVITLVQGNNASALSVMKTIDDEGQSKGKRIASYD